jgi:hypothetical protein
MKIKFFLKRKSIIKKKLYKLENDILNLKQELKNLEKTILSSCEHEWVLDNNSCVNIKSDKICLKCESIIYRF